jgi:hypothetical protein
MAGASFGVFRHFASNHPCPGVRKYPGREREPKEGVLSRVKRMVALLATSALLVGAVGSTALAVNDPLVPGDECSAGTQAVGHPAFANQQDNPQGANPPFSSNNPGVSTGAKGTANSEALAHCPNA